MGTFKEDTLLVKTGGLIALIIGIFHLYTSTVGVLESYLHRGVHLYAMLLVIFLVKPLKKDHQYHVVLRTLDIILLLLTLSVGFYQSSQSYQLLLRAGNPTSVDLLFGLLLIILVLEATRRTIGLPLTVVAAAFLLYVYFGPYMPRLISHAGYNLKEIISVQFLGTSGLFGMPLGVMSTYIIIFVIFGAILGETGAILFFNNLARSLVGHMTGGPAKISVVASGIMGSVSGSVVANVVTTGSFTIPMMRERGYHPVFAGAVEAAASTGGQIMPPIMGATAFLIAEFLNIPYVYVAFTAILPAFLYYISLGIVVHLEAVKYGLKNVPKSECPKTWGVLKEGGILLIPLILLTVLLIKGYTPMRAGMAGIGSLIIVVLYLNARKYGIKNGIGYAAVSFIRGIQKGVLSAVGVTAATAAAGIIIGAVAQSGIGLRLTSLILNVAGGSLPLTLVLTGLACLILGMGMPTAGAYVIVATLGAPALVKLGVMPLAAHLFVFYMAMMSAVTPPVAVGAYAAAGITNSSAWNTGLVAFKIALVGFLIPFIIVYEPALILQGSVLAIIHVFITSLVGVFCLALGLQGFLLRTMNWPERVVCIAGGLALINPSVFTDVFGLTVLLGTFFYQKATPDVLSKHKGGAGNSR